jgi:hypothetical protein
MILFKLLLAAVLIVLSTASVTLPAAVLARPAPSARAPPRAQTWPRSCTCPHILGRRRRRRILLGATYSPRALQSCDPRHQHATDILGVFFHLSLFFLKILYSTFNLCNLCVLFISIWPHIFVKKNVSSQHDLGFATSPCEPAIQVSA